VGLVTETGLIAAAFLDDNARGVDGDSTETTKGERRVREE
jgi:hypothetical protein